MVKELLPGSVVYLKAWEEFHEELYYREMEILTIR
jgi:hypothetical protein